MLMYAIYASGSAKPYQDGMVSSQERFALDIDLLYIDLLYIDLH